MRTLSLCGLLAGLAGGLAAAGFSSIAGEPAVNAAIAYEDRKAADGVVPAEEAPVSRAVQQSVGLAGAAVTYGIALGGIFALVFAFAYGRVGDLSPARTALWLAGTAFVVLYLVPFLKYPASPPAVGRPETIDHRTSVYVVMVIGSVLLAVAAIRTRPAAGPGLRWHRDHGERRRLPHRGPGPGPVPAHGRRGSGGLPRHHALAVPRGGDRRAARAVVHDRRAPRRARAASDGAGAHTPPRLTSAGTTR